MSNERPEDDEEAFAARLEAVSEAAYRLIRSLGVRPEDAADALQNASIRAWRHQSQRHGEFDPWFLTIAYREARRLKRPWITVPASWRATPAATAEEWPGSHFDAVLQHLPPRQRVALSLRYDADLSNAAVGVVLGISEAAAKQLLARARASFRRAYAVAGGETT